jgi:pimeloyl-ACP methyl ester carboxylesterase
MMRLFTLSRWLGSLQVFWMAMVISVMFTSFPLLAETHGKKRSMQYPVFYRTIQFEGLSIVYREAGRKDAPTILLLHGVPSSSRMFQPLLTRLADNYHLVAPDYPGYGHSDWPDPKQFDYTFDHIASVIDDFTQALGLSHYTLYMQDYGGPIGFRLALAHPDRVQALIVQDAVAHNEGLGANWATRRAFWATRRAFWATRRAFWADRPAHEEALRKNLLSLATTKTRHIGDDPEIELYDPDLWTDEYAFLNAPGQAQIQSDLFYDYRTNVDAYPKWQAWLQKTQPKLLVLWGKHDLSFDLGEPERYRQDVPKAEVYVLDAGHFALDTKADQIAALVREFTTKEIPETN